MSATMPAFDTYKYIRALRDAGFTETQAEAQSTALLQAYDSHMDRLATKDDVRLLRDDMKSLTTELRGEMAVLRSVMEGQATLLRWVAGSSMFGALSGAVAGAAVLLRTLH